MSKCVVCKNEVDFEEVKEDFSEVFAEANYWGFDSRDENQQMVLNGKICSLVCFDNLD